MAGESGRASLLTPSPTDLLLDGEEDDLDADGFPLTQPALDAAPSWNTARLDLSMHRRPADSLSGFASQPSQPSQDDVPLDHYDFDNGDDDGGGMAASLDSSQYSHLAALLQSAGIGTQALAGWPSLTLSPTPTHAAGGSSSTGGRRYYATASTGADDDDEDNDGTSDDNDEEGDLEGVEGMHEGSATNGAAATALVSYAFGHGHDRMEEEEEDDDDDLGDGLDANSSALDMGPGALERLRARVAANAAAVLQQYGEEEEEDDDDDADLDD